jgi:thioredoxin reductase (NADPH)
MFVVGGGDAACDEAQYLSHLTDKVTLIHRRERFRAQKALAERVLHNPHIEVRFNTVMNEIKGDGKVASVVLTTNGERREEATDAVFIFAGTIPQSQLADGLGVEKDAAGYLIANQRMETKVPGFYVAGDVHAGAFRQVVVACAEGAIAAHNAAAYIDALRGEAY